MEAIYHPSNVTPAFPRPFSETIACAASDLHVEASSRITSRASSVIIKWQTRESRKCCSTFNSRIER